MMTVQPAHHLRAYAKAMELLPNVIFFVKDEDRRYRLANAGMAKLCGVSNAAQLLGRSTAEFFERSYVAWCNELDRDVLSGSSYERRLDCVTDAQGEQLWTLYSRLPIRVDDRSQCILSVSQVLGLHGDAADRYRRLRRVTDAVFADIGGHWTLDRMATIAGSSHAVLERDFREVFQCGARAYLDQARVQVAKDLIVAGEPLIEIAPRVGLSEQSALSRFFRRMTGETPRQFRVRALRTTSGKDK